MPFPSPRHDESARRLDLLVLADHNVLAVDVDAVAPTRSWIELGPNAHPLHESGAVGEIGEDDLGGRLDPLRNLDGAGGIVNHDAVSLVGPRPLPVASAGPARPTTSAAGRSRAGRAPCGRRGNSGTSRTAARKPDRSPAGRADSARSRAS